MQVLTDKLVARCESAAKTLESWHYRFDCGYCPMVSYSKNQQVRGGSGGILQRSTTSERRGVGCDDGG